jgi:hypothetical protein
MPDSSTALRVSPPLPVSLQRYLQAQRTINDLVEDAFIGLDRSDENEKFRSYLTALYPEHAVEGSLPADDFEAAHMIREWAKTHESMELADEKIATVVKALKVVMRRYRISRPERREQRHGIPPVSDGDQG